MSPQFSWNDQTNGSLNVASLERPLLAVPRYAAGFLRDNLKKVQHKGVHDSHALLGDAQVGVHQLQVSVNKGRVAVRLSLVFALGFACRLGQLRSLSSLGGCLCVTHIWEPLC